ncbi:MAG: 2-oxoglutarate dehydrogenase E1 component [Gemmatimonadetes bacterium]|nr:2-oxoglutarate dehydrogenase E1 component [Gemmatimonadota bacterium]
MQNLRIQRELFDSYNAGYAQEMLDRFARDPGSVPEEWRRIFLLDNLEAAGLVVPAELDRRRAGVAAETASPRLLSAVARGTQLIQAFREFGHQLARLDPLGSEPPGHPQLDPSFFALTHEELTQVSASVVGIGRDDESLAAALERLRRTYCGTIGYEFEHLEDPEKVEWLWETVETGRHRSELGPEREVSLLERLSDVEGLERFLHRAYLGQKRFSIEGTDMLIPMLDLAVELAAEAGGQEVIIGMAHRGRLNVLAHILGLPYERILREFEGGAYHPTETLTLDLSTGDVKYHHGAVGTPATRQGALVRVTLVPNPSHLEFVNPVVEGLARARQTLAAGGQGTDPAAALPVLIHGDAAFAAEGIVAETLNLARLAAYATGGTLHIIANNQIGFTTPPEQGRSTRYASDLAKGYDIPVIHVNADDPEACLASVRLAMAYRSRFRDDVVIDLIGYRRHGHNEGDEPFYTQPVLYSLIEKHPTVRDLWARALVDDGIVTRERVEELQDAVALRLRGVQEALKHEGAGLGSGHSTETAPPEPRSPDVETAVPFERLAALNTAALSFPEGFNVHPKLAKQFERRRSGFTEEAALDWAHAEMLAFASLLDEGVPIRMSGQDTERGTFSQRHLVLHDVKSGARRPLLDSAAAAEIVNSPLSEAGILGFEYGYSVGAGSTFVLWEAQFGDFMNAAQVIVDQFIAAGREKWGQTSRLTLLLPHGYEGQGPEHSSARIERFLQLSAEGNLRVAYPTTPAQYFHLLRRQALAPEARPLVVFTPKSLLRHPLATSRAQELARGRFQRTLDDAAAASRREHVTRLILCTGKIYYDLRGSEDGRYADRVAIARIEELYPFPGEGIGQILERYPALEEIVWTQEEPRNMGALAYIEPRLRCAAPDHVTLRYVARSDRASPAEGRAYDHAREQERIVRDALSTGATVKG